MHDAPAAIRHQRHFARLAGFEAHRGAGRDIEPLATRGGAVERQRGVGFGEVIVAADLDRPVAGVGDGQRGAGKAGVQLDVAGGREDFAGDLSSDRLVHGDQLGAVGKRRLDLHVVDHLGDAFHHLRSA